jgi:hypothetical protein
MNSTKNEPWDGRERRRFDRRRSGDATAKQLLPPELTDRRQPTSAPIAPPAIARPSPPPSPLFTLSVADIYDAMDHFSQRLYVEIRRIASARGFAAHEASAMLVPGRTADRRYMVSRTNVLFPAGHAASFVPSVAPSRNEQKWTIDIKRSDGVSRAPWNEGLVLKRSFTLCYRDRPLTEQMLALLLEQVAIP